MADYEHGKMNIDEHEKTFEGFVKASSYVVIGVLVFLVFLALANG
ncbi:MAG: aa3-type cytochrome c oxidase subunit IV [Qingshengfaniella sp.]